MWCTRRLAGWAAVAVILASGVAACGFRPLHGQGSGGAPENLASIQINRIMDREGQKLRNLLLDRLTPTGPPAHPRYVLDVTLRESLQNLAIRKDESATRANLTVTALFSLARVGTDEIFDATAVSTNSYNILESDFATLSAENDARSRALRYIADDIRARLAAALSNPAFFKRPAKTK